MFEKCMIMWDNCVNNVKNFFNSYRNGDPIIMKKSLNCSLSFFKKSTPDKNIFNISVSGEPEATLIDAIVFMGLVTAGLSVIGLISRALFKR